MNTYLIRHGEGGPVFLYGASREASENGEKLERVLQGILPENTSYTLAVYAVEDWNAAFSPWEAAAEEMYFAGEGGQTLQWLTKEWIPAVRRKDETVYTLGYSLAGLFSLWALLNSEELKGAVCCSGSLWFPGWDDFASAHLPKGGQRIYLSLGGKEADSANPVMATVESACKRQFERNRMAPGVEAKYELNSGGHFANAEKRLAKGIMWVLRDSANKP